MKKNWLSSLTAELFIGEFRVKSETKCEGPSSPRNLLHDNRLKMIPNGYLHVVLPVMVIGVRPHWGKLGLGQFAVSSVTLSVFIGIER